MDFFQITYETLFYPRKLFKAISVGPMPKELLLIFTMIVVWVVSAIAVVYSPRASELSLFLIVKMMFSGVAGLVFWAFCSVMYALTAYVFSGRGRPQTLLILTGLSSLPWLFFPLVMSFKNALGVFGHLIAVLGTLGIWTWTVVLFLMALKYTYNLTLARVLLAACLPIILSFIGTCWFLGTLSNSVIQLLIPS